MSLGIYLTIGIICSLVFVYKTKSFEYDTMENLVTSVLIFCSFACAWPFMFPLIWIDKR